MRSFIGVLRMWNFTLLLFFRITVLGNLITFTKSFLAHINSVKETYVEFAQHLEARRNLRSPRSLSPVMTSAMGSKNSRLSYQRQRILLIRRSRIYGLRFNSILLYNISSEFIFRVEKRVNPNLQLALIMVRTLLWRWEKGLLFAGSQLENHGQLRSYAMTSRTRKKSLTKIFAGKMRIGLTKMLLKLETREHLLRTLSS